MSALKTIKQEEPIARSRFTDCPVCKNHTLKLKKVVQVGRCKSCNETYKVIVVYVKTPRKAKSLNLTSVTQSKPESKTEPSEPVLPSLEKPSDSSLFGSTTSPYSGLSEAIFGKTDKPESTGTGSSSGQ